MKTKEEQRFELVKEWLPFVAGRYDSDLNESIRLTIELADIALFKLNESAPKRETKTPSQEPFSDRLSDFRREVDKFSHKYPKTMLDGFYNYWSEPNKTQTKMRWEGEKTWEIGRRLTTWASRAGIKPMEAPKVDNDYLAFKRKYEKA